MHDTIDLVKLYLILYYILDISLKREEIQMNRNINKGRNIIYYRHLSYVNIPDKYCILYILLYILYIRNIIKRLSYLYFKL